MPKHKRVSDPAIEEQRPNKFRAVIRDSLEGSPQAERSGSVVPTEGQNDQSVLSQSEQDSRENGTQELRWTLRQAVGGRILDLSPLFTEDDKYYLVAYPSKIKVFSCSTGLCARTLATHSKGIITALALSSNDPSRVYIGLSSGRIELWDWTIGERIFKWDTGAQLFKLCVAHIRDEDEDGDLLYVVEEKDGKWNVVVHRLFVGGSQERNEVRTLMTREDPIDSLFIAHNLRTIVLHAGKTIVIGAKRGAKTLPIRGLRYIWREFDCSEQIVTIDSRVTAPPIPDALPAVVDLAVGTAKGAIYVYRNVLDGLIRAQSSQMPALPAFRYHWHRTAVGSVVWSKDGNYVLSGGSETVLVLWQLDTNHKSYLPHLAAAIRQITLSATGTRYGLVLSNNSSLVLNALDLKPMVRVSEPHIRFNVRPRRTLTSPNPVQSMVAHRRPALDVARISSSIVASSPAHSHVNSASQQSAASPFLQALDHKSGQELFKQALARTKLTDRNMGPQGNTIEEPDIVLLRVSSDGKWLATVDEWLVPAKDREPFGDDIHADEHAPLGALDSFLKFWQWSESTQRWELVWRVELCSEKSALTRRRAVILDLVEDPSRTRFFTIDTELTVRGWEPRQRLRYGKQVQDQRQNDLSNWISYDVVQLNNSSVKSEHSLSAKLTVSQDGSLLVAAFASHPASSSSENTETTSSISLIKLASRTLLTAQSGLLHGPVLGLAIDRSTLVILSEDVMLWDLVNHGLTRIADNAANKAADFTNGTGKASSRRKLLSQYFALDYKHLALSAGHQIVAIAIPVSEHKSRIALFHPRSQSFETVLEVPSLIRGLLPAPNREGFVALTEDLEIVTIASSAGAIKASDNEQAEIKMPGAMELGFERIFGKAAAQLTNGEQSSIEDSVATDADGQPKSKDAQLHELLSKNKALAMPPMMTMFKQVAAIFAKG